MFKLAGCFFEMALACFGIAWGYLLFGMWKDNPDNLSTPGQLAITGMFLVYLGFWCLADVVISHITRSITYGNASMDGDDGTHAEDRGQ